MADSETQRIRGIYERDADRYDREISHFERRLLEDGRSWACGQATGDVLEVAIGTGRNLPLYPDGVTLTGIDMSAAMLEKAKERARALGRDVTLRIGDAQALDFPDETFGTVVMTLALCTIPDDGKAIAEAKRVLRPGGRLILLEHVRSPLLPVRIVQRVLDPVLIRWKGDHLMREPLDWLHAHGFDVQQCERRKWGLIERVIAMKPASTD
jgi:ubiquinone/menaquinone biosynthesis C-methylase UbiE